MTQLSAKDLHAALAFVDEAHSFTDLESFRDGILPGLERLVPCDLVGYNEVYPDGEEALVITYPDPPLAFAGEVLARLAHQHPLIAAQANGDDRAYKISDFLSSREFHSLELYDELYRLLGAEDQIACGLPGPLVIGIAMNRDRRSFGERDRAMLDLLGPHLARAHTRARQRTEAERLIAILERGLRERDAAVVALARSGAIAAASGAAVALLNAYFPEHRGDRLPAAISDWLAAAPEHGPAPLNVSGERGRLTVREVASAQTPLLVLAEERAAGAEELRSLGLTPRQSEILHLLTQGRRVDQIATDLFISPRTVRKHIEHVYACLGVHSRAAAVAAAREVAKPGPIP